MEKVSYLPETRIKDLSGKVFGRLTVKRFTRFTISNPSNKGYTQKIAHYLCKCSCGNETEVFGSNLVRGITKSCGCLAKEFTSKMAKGNSFRQIPIEERTINYIYYYIKDGAKKRGCRSEEILFSLTKEEVESLIYRECQYCKRKPEGTIKQNNREILDYNGIDRVDNSLGYITGNCVPCCKKCNFDKNRVPVNTMVEALKFLGYKVEKIV